ncbi:mucin-3A-like [Pezoporus occidentalis]|uniref:mucin-3A-like n=1 Tax=Pezoporus occidentalis TaxID=407982 RepID=UPI002F91A2E4
MKTKIDNREFTTELQDKSSPAFQDFEKEFKEQMRDLYKNIEGYQDVVILELTQGSIVVNYTVLLKVPASTKANETLKTISNDLIIAITNSTTCNENCERPNCSFCFNAVFTNITSYKVEEVEKSVCESLNLNNFSSFYSPLLTATGVICITRCDQRTTDPLPCIFGTCKVLKEGPECMCSDKAAFWYQDKACSSRISKVGVAIGVPVTGLVLAIGIFTIFLVRARRQKEMYRDKLTSISELYCSIEESWSSPQGFATNNQGFMLEDLETPSTTQIYLEKVDTSQKIHIEKPSQIIIP